LVLNLSVVSKTSGLLSTETTDAAMPQWLIRQAFAGPFEAFDRLDVA